MKLKGQTALITGASRGIGEAIARALAAEGAQVAITGRSAQELETLQKSLAGWACDAKVSSPISRKTGPSSKCGRKRRKRLDILTSS